MSLSITDVWHGSTLVVELAGRLDTQTAKVFEDHLGQQIGRGNRSMVVDMQHIDYVSSYGLRVFLLTAKKLRGDRNAFILCGLTPDVLKIFQISGFDKILTIRKAIEDVIPAGEGARDARP